MNHIPTIALVGRPNVGKSTIFNRLVEERISIVEDQPGVTRDRIYAYVHWLDRSYRLIDTGGIINNDEPLMDQVQAQAEIAMDEADVIIMVCDARDGMTRDDEYIVRILRQLNKPIILAINKADNPEQRMNIYDFYSLGLGEPMPISGAHGTGLGDLLDQVNHALPDTFSDTFEDDRIKFSFIGRPNVGKSSLVNALLNEERVIVSNIAGTTREAVDTDFVDKEGNEFTMIDTAGIRKSGRVWEATEKYSAMRAMSAIDRSDVVCVVINAEEGIKDQDKHIAGYAYEAGKGIIILVNKWDAIEKDNKTHQKFTEEVRQAFKYLSFAPILFVSAKTGQRLDRLPELILTVKENHARRIQSSLLNDVLMDAIALNPTPSDKGRRLKIFYMTQVTTEPPTFVVFVNDIELMHFSYERFLENQLRQSFHFEGTPIKIITRARK